MDLDSNSPRDAETSGGVATEVSPMRRKISSAPGIRARHSRGCDSNDGRTCNCRPTYEAAVFSAKDGQKIRRTFATITAAKSWRSDATSAVHRGAMRAPSATTLREAWTTWLEGAKSGKIRNRSGDAYKPSVLRSYETSMRLRVLDDLGGAKLCEISRIDLQDLADRMLAAELDPSTIRNTFMPLRVVFRRAVHREGVVVNPTSGLELPAVRGRRDRIASANEAALLIDAIPDEERALWATAFYSGLRLGELQALRDEDVDLRSGVIHVRRSWDKVAGPIAPKSRAGTRKVPIVGALRAHLAAHRLRRGSEG